MRKKKKVASLPEGLWKPGMHPHLLLMDFENGLPKSVSLVRFFFLLHIMTTVRNPWHKSRKDQIGRQGWNKTRMTKPKTTWQLLPSLQWSQFQNTALQQPSHTHLRGGAAFLFALSYKQVQTSLPLAYLPIWIELHNTMIWLFRLIPILTAVF